MMDSMIERLFSDDVTIEPILLRDRVAKDFVDERIGLLQRCVSASDYEAVIVQIYTEGFEDGVLGE